jgi:hypothetical protein
MNLDELLSSIRNSLKAMEKEDPRAYKDWLARLESYEERLSSDLKQAIRWNGFHKNIETEEK